MKERRAVSPFVCCLFLLRRRSGGFLDLNAHRAPHTMAKRSGGGEQEEEEEEMCQGAANKSVASYL